MVEAGFQVEKRLVLHPAPALLGRLRNRRSGGHTHCGLAMAVPPAPLNAILDVYTRLEDVIVSLCPFVLTVGDAQLVLAFKPEKDSR